MTVYAPEEWVIIRIDTLLAEEPLYKVLAGWRGGYVEPDSWQLNSGITSVVESDDYYSFHGYSGSVYHCHKAAERLSFWLASILDGFQRQAAEAGGGSPLKCVPVAEVLEALL